MLRKYRYQDQWINASVLILSILGLVMIGSASVGSASLHGSNWVVMNMVKHSVFVIVGYVIMILCSRFFKVNVVNMKSWRILYLCGILAMLACLAFPAVNGSKAWIPLGFASIQPSEFMKVLLILTLSLLLSNHIKAFQYHGKFRSQADKENYYKEKFKRCVGEPLLLCVIALACVVIQKDLGTMMIMLLICVAVFYSANDPYYRKYQHIFLIAGGILIVVAIPFLLSGFRMGRITSWLNPLSDPYGSSLQLLNGLIAFSNKGHLFGLGFGNSTQKYGYIPYAYNDFIASIIYEELGMIGLALIMIPYAIIIFRLLKYSMEVSSSRDKMVLVGISSYFFMHLFINIGGVSGLIPMTGVPLLLVSLGGSSTISAFMAIGFAQSVISKHNKVKYHTSVE